jgi:peptide/nickel transport system permease protein/glutathione transport system permease protein
VRRIVPILCGLYLLLVLVCVVTGSAFAPHDPSAQDPLLGASTPGPGHPLGTDQLGRDVLSQLIAGARTAVFGPLLVAIGCVVLGGTLGLLAAYHGGLTDLIANRTADLIYALPALLVAIVVVGVAGGGYWITVVLLLVLSVPSEIRLCRSAASAQTRLPYVDAARTLGLPTRRIVFRHVLPNVMPTVVATFLLDLVAALIGFSALSFLGIGVPLGSPDWGSMLAGGRQLIAQNPWLSVAPAVLLILTAVSATLLGDWAYDRLSVRRGARA